PRKTSGGVENQQLGDCVGRRKPVVRRGRQYNQRASIVADHYRRAALSRIIWELTATGHPIVGGDYPRALLSRSQGELKTHSRVGPSIARSNQVSMDSTSALNTRCRRATGRVPK